MHATQTCPGRSRALAHSLRSRSRAPTQVESSWREKDASKTKELDAAQAKLARVESKLNAALNNAPPPAGEHAG